MSEKKTPAIRFKGFADDWEQRKIEDLAEVNPKSVIPEKFEYVDLESVVGTEIIAHRTETRDSAPSRAQRLAKKGDVFYQTVRPYQKNNCLFEGAERSYVFSTGYAQLRSHGDSYFLLTMLQREDFVNNVLDRCTGTSYPAINANVLADLTVSYPVDIQEQIKIGQDFKRLDYLITLHQRKLTKLQLLKKSMLTKMFPKDGARVPEIRFQGFHDDWKLHPLNELAVFGGGHTPSMADEANYKKDGICWVTSQDVKTDYLFDTCTKLSDKGASELKLYPDGTIIMVTRSGILRHTLPIALLKIPATVNQDIRTISVGLSCSSTWLMHYLKVHERELLLNYGKVGTTVESIDFSKLKTMDLLVPTMDEQEKIGAYFSRMDDLIAIHQHNIAKWQHIKQAMLSKLFV